MYECTVCHAKRDVRLEKLEPVEPPTEPTEPTEPDYKKGDVNEDGSVDLMDLRITLRAICGKISLSERQSLILDVNGDKKVDLLDLRMILRYICNKIDML